MKLPPLKRALPGALAVLAAAGPCLAWAEPPGYESRWQVELMPYLWSTGLSGNARVGPSPAGAGSEPHFADQGNKPTFGFALEAGGENTGVLLDVARTKLSHAADFALAGAAGRVHFDGTQDVLQLTTAYRLSDDPEFYVDVLAGLRYAAVDLDQRPATPPLSGTGQRQRWTDGVLGLRVMERLSQRVWVMASGDVGRGGSKHSWQGQIGAHFQLTDALSVKVGYRLLSMRYVKPDFLYEVQNEGGYAGLALRF
jgi:opacity protein-like surface antigen